MTMSPDKIKERLEANHLALEDEDAVEDLRKELAEKVSGELKEKPKPQVEREYPFKFEWKDGRGKVWRGAFVNKILTIKDRQMVGVLRARMSGGLEAHALDELTQEINLMIAHMTFSLTDKPDWAKDLTALDDIRLLQELYEEVASHEAIFHGYAQTN